MNHIDSSNSTVLLEMKERIESEVVCKDERRRGVIVFVALQVMLRGGNFYSVVSNLPFLMTAEETRFLRDEACTWTEQQLKDYLG